MALDFPNPTRSFDEKRNAVQFVGHDGMFEIRFFVEVSALDVIESRGKAAPEDICLAAFDRLRSSIHEVARKTYSKSRLSSYTLSAASFR